MSGAVFPPSSAGIVAARYCQYGGARGSDGDRVRIRFVVQAGRCHEFPAALPVRRRLCAGAAVIMIPSSDINSD